MELTSNSIVSSYKDIEITICKTHKEIANLIKFIKLTGHCSLDFETNAKHPSSDEFYPTIMGISFQPGSRYVVPLKHFQSPFKNNNEWLKILNLFNTEVFLNVEVAKIAQNTKFELQILRKYGFNMYGVVFDTMLAKHILDENTLNGLKDVIARLFPNYMNYDAELKILLRQYKNWENIPLAPLSTYCALDSDLTLQLHILLERRLLRDPRLYSLYRNLAMMNTRVLAETETWGIRVDLEYLTRIEKEEAIKMSDNLTEIHNLRAVRKFEKERKKNHIGKLIDKVSLELDDYYTRDRSIKKVETAIKHREDKITRYIAGIFTTVKETYEEFNINSVQQLQEFLFNNPKGLKLPILAYTLDKQKRPTTKASTAEADLLNLIELDHAGFVEKLISHRKLQKIYSTYIVGILEKVNPRTSYLHGSFNISGTVTGRLSSRNPNMQNMPRDTTSSIIKRMFTPPLNHLLVEMDYSQAELRYIAELSGDKAMIDIFKRGYNIHLATGLKLVGRLDDYEIADKLRNDSTHPDYEYWKKVHKGGKVINFSILYQQSDKMVGEALNISVEEAGKFKAIWFKQFPGVTKYIKDSVKKTKEDGYVRNAFGRFRRLPDIKLNPRRDKKSAGKYNAAVRESINAPIQGGSSDYTQAAAIEIWEKRMLKLKPFCYASHEVYTVHDSIGWYVRADKIHEFVKSAKRVGEKPNIHPYYKFQMEKVEMKVSVEIGKNSWGELTKYDTKEDYTKWINL